MGRGDQRAAEAVVLEMLGAGAAQGYDVCARLARRAGLSHGAAYGVVYTLEGRGLIESREEVGSDGAERRWYSLTGVGVRRAARTGGTNESVPSAAAAAGVIA
jgi:DNA-binding PadR family transcriptional regulator